jgi:hypothetical protein
MAKSKSTPKVQISKEERNWKVQSAMDTLKRAADIQKDKGLMRDVLKATQDLQKAVMGGIVNTPKKK